MLQLQYLREHTNEAKERIGKRNPAFAAVVDEVLKLDEQTRSAKQLMEANQAEANKLARQIGELMKTGKREEAESLKQQTASLKEQAKTLEENTKQLEDELFNKLVSIPNAPHQSVPLGKTPEK